MEKDSVELESNAAFIVRRVLELGQYKDWKLLVSRYGIPMIAHIAQNLRTLDPKALSFISAVSSTPKESFRCYFLPFFLLRIWLFYILYVSLRKILLLI